MKQKMGERQRWAWIAAALSGVAAAEICRFHWLWVLLGGFGASFYMIWLDRKLDHNALQEKMSTVFGRFGTVLIGLLFAWTVVVMGWTAALADKAFPMVDGFPSLGWILLGLAAWGSWKGIEACAGCSGVLCLFLLALYGVIGGFSVSDIKVENLQKAGTWYDAIWVFGLFLLPASVCCVPCRRNQKGSVGIMALFLPAFASGLSGATAGVLGSELLQQEFVPLYTLAQSVSLFGVVERIEPLLSAAMTMGIFSLISILACACRCMLQEWKHCRWGGPAACLIAALVMFSARNLTVALLTAGTWFFWVMIPLVTILWGKMKGTEDEISIDGGVEM